VLVTFGEFFKRYEFACNCGCGFDTVDAELLSILTTARLYFEKEISIISGCRCPVWNKEWKGSSSKSQHLIGRAADISVDSVPASNVYEYFTKMYPLRYGIGYYKTFVHIDTRRLPARWQEESLLSRKMEVANGN